MKKEDLIYDYCNRDLLVDSEKYFYSRFYGKEFLKAWKKVRLIVLENQDNEMLEKQMDDNISLQEFSNNSFIETSILLDYILNSKSDINLSEEYLRKILKRFEISKKIFDRYSLTFRAHDKKLNSNKMLYVKTSLAICRIYEKTKNIIYLNTLLKVNDILCSVFKQIVNDYEKKIIFAVIRKEITFIEELMKKNGINYE